APSQPHSTSPRLQAGVGLAARRWPSLRRWPADRGADPWRRPRFGLRAGDGNELLHPVDAARHLVALAGDPDPDRRIASDLRGATWSRSAAQWKQRPTTSGSTPTQLPVLTPRRPPSVRKVSAFASRVPRAT